MILLSFVESDRHNGLKTSPDFLFQSSVDSRELVIPMATISLGSISSMTRFSVPIRMAYNRSMTSFHGRRRKVVKINKLTSYLFDSVPQLNRIIFFLVTTFDLSDEDFMTGENLSVFDSVNL